MKHLKTYESIKDNIDPQVGDYVICNEDRDNIGNSQTDEDFKIVADIVKNNIGQCIEIFQGIYYIKYDDNILDNIDNIKKFKPYFDHTHIENKTGENIRRMNREEIISFSPNKETLETIMSANKYNL